MAACLQEVPQGYIEMEARIETVPLSFDNMFSHLVDSYPFLRSRLELRWTEDGYSTQCIILRKCIVPNHSLNAFN